MGAPPVQRDPNLHNIAAARGAAQGALAAKQEGQISPDGEFAGNVGSGLLSTVKGVGAGLLGGELETAAQMAPAGLANAPAEAAKSVIGPRYDSAKDADIPYRYGVNVGKIVPGIVNFIPSLAHSLTKAALDSDLAPVSKGEQPATPIHTEVINQVAGMLPGVGPVQTLRATLNAQGATDQDKADAWKKFWYADLPANAFLWPMMAAGARHGIESIRGKLKGAPPAPDTQALSDALDKAEAPLLERDRARQHGGNIRLVDGEWVSGAKVPGEIAQRTGRPVTTVRLFNKDGTENAAAWDQAFGRGPAADAAKDSARKFIQTYKPADVRPSKPEVQFAGLPPEPLPDERYQQQFSQKAAVETPAPPADTRVPQTRADVAASHAEADSMQAVMDREAQAKREGDLAKKSQFTKVFSKATPDTPPRIDASFSERMAGRTRAEQITRALTPEQARETGYPRKVPEAAGAPGGPGLEGPFSAAEGAAAPRLFEERPPSYYKETPRSDVSHYDIGGPPKPEPGKIVTPEEASARPSSGVVTPESLKPKPSGRLITDETAAASRAALKGKPTITVNGLLDPEVLRHSITLGLYHLETGAREFGPWAAKMMASEPRLQPHMKQIWDAIQSGDVPVTSGGQSDLQAAEAVLKKPLGGPKPTVRQRVLRARAIAEGEMLPLDMADRTLRGAQKPDITMGKRMELTAGAAGKAGVDVHDFQKAIEAPLAKTKDINNLETYLFTERVKARLADDPSAKHVEGWTAERANSAQNELAAKVGAERFKAIKDVAHGVYQSAMDKALKLQVESGRMSQEVYDYIKQRNPFYAPFKVVKYLTEEGPRGQDLGRRIATVADYTKAIKGIHEEGFGVRILDPSANSIVRSRILAEKNLAMKALSEWTKNDTQGAFIRRLKDGEAVPAGMERVKYFEDGKEVSLALRPDLAKSVQGLNPVQMGLLGKFLRGTAGPFKFGTVGANLAFQAVNLPYDMLRMTALSKAGASGPLDAARLPVDFVVGAYDSFMANMLGKMTSRYRQFAQSGAKGSTIADVTYGEKQGRSLTSEPKGKAWAAFKRNTLERVSDFGNAIEETTKMTAHNRLTRAGEMSPEAIASEVRNYGGSPDFARHGSSGPEMNLLQMFMNSRIQGISADLSRLAGRTGGDIAVKAWGRLALPAMAVTVNMLNNLSDENIEDYNGIDQNERDNNIIILKAKGQYIVNSRGVRVRDHWNIPKRDVTGALFDTMEQAVKLAHDKDPKSVADFGMQMLQDVSPINISGRNLTERGQSVLSGFHPFIKAPVEVLAGKKFYSHQDLPAESLQRLDADQQASPQTPDFFKWLGSRERLSGIVPDYRGASPDVLAHVASSLLGSGPMSVFPRKPLEGQSDLIGLPVIGQVVQRFSAHGGQDLSKFYDTYNDATKAKATFDNFISTGQANAARAFFLSNKDRIIAYERLKPIADELFRQSKSGRMAQEQGKPPMPMPNLQPLAAKAVQ